MEMEAERHFGAAFGFKVSTTLVFHLRHSGLVSMIRIVDGKIRRGVIPLVFPSSTILDPYLPELVEYLSITLARCMISLTISSS